MLLHLIGARWIYSFVPYDEWAATLTGRSLSERFGWQRNHYDRLVHLCFGVLGVPPAVELLQQFGNMRPRGAALMGVASVLALGGIYEVLEWQVAVIFSPAHAEAYNGQQGDLWDAQKDMALQGLGAIVAGLACSSSLARRVRFSSPHPDSLP
jgi:putative membrane protein